jgi:hypothetical protein
LLQLLTHALDLRQRRGPFPLDHGSLTFPMKCRSSVLTALGSNHWMQINVHSRDSGQGRLWQMLGTGYTRYSWYLLSLSLEAQSVFSNVPGPSTPGHPPGRSHTFAIWSEM